MSVIDISLSFSLIMVLVAFFFQDIRQMVTSALLNDYLYVIIIWHSGKVNQMQEVQKSYNLVIYIYIKIIV